MSFSLLRPRRLRMHPVLRDLVCETRISKKDLVQPIFVRTGNKSKSIQSMPGCFQLCLKDLKKELEKIEKNEINAIILFGIPDHKNEIGSIAWQKEGIVQKSIEFIKKEYPHILVIADLCFCEYTSHGHCGVLKKINKKMDVDNDATLLNLAKLSLSLAHAGADVIAPSGMMDGMVKTLRTALDEKDFSHIPILSYAVKYASGFYGPFANAAENKPKKGDRKTYQMDPANAKEALKEAMLDIEEGADILMVKPALAYLDVIFAVKQRFPQTPLAAYQVSGEFAMIKAAAQKGWIDENRLIHETLTSIKRAGADFIITYFAKDFKND